MTYFRNTMIQFDAPEFSVNAYNKWIDNLEGQKIPLPTFFRKRGGEGLFFGVCKLIGMKTVLICMACQISIKKISIIIIIVMSINVTQIYENYTFRAFLKWLVC